MKSILVGILMGLLAYLSLRFIPIKAHAVTVFLRSIGIGAVIFIIYVGLGKLVRSEIFDVAISYGLSAVNHIFKRIRR